jgi:hypothetical protein
MIVNKLLGRILLGFFLLFLNYIYFKKFTTNFKDDIQDKLFLMRIWTKIHKIIRLGS